MCKIIFKKQNSFPNTGIFVCFISHIQSSLSPRPRINRLHMPNFFALRFMLFSTAADDSYKFEREIQIQSNDLNSLAASIQE